MSRKTKIKPNVTQEFLRRFCELEKNFDSSDSSGIFDFLCFYESRKPYINPIVIREIIFYELPKLCFLKQLGDSTAVSEVLLSIHNLKKKGVSHVVIFLILNLVTHRCLPSKMPRNKKKMGYSFIAFFLHHATAKKLTFEGRRITEMIEGMDPRLYARIFLLSDSKSVFTLLQFGLKFETSERNFKIRVHPIFLYVLEILIAVWKEMHQKSMPKKKLEAKIHPRQLPVLLKNFQIILRANYNPCRVIRDMITTSAEISPLASEHFNGFFSRLFPSLNFKQQSLPTLKHLCRCVIRDRLFEEWHLPYGIRSLPLKADLIKYICLCFD